MPKLSTLQQKQRHERILDAAERSFGKSGFHRTTMQDICKEAGISAGALYLYFDSKEALIAGIVERDREQILEKFTALNHATDFLEGLQTLMQTCILDQPRHKSALFIEMGAEATRNPAIAAIIGQCDAAILASLEQLIMRAEREGRVAPKIPVPQFVAVLALIADGMFWRSAVNPRFDTGAVAQLVMAMIAPLLGGSFGTPPAVHPSAQPRQFILSDLPS